MKQDRPGTAGVLACPLANKLLSLLNVLFSNLVRWDGGQAGTPAVPVRVGLQLTSRASIV
jgi:hypothetical protein